ncbi:MAG: hypothetical protein LBE82_06800 [Chitinophagaceae bacterium]|jgi:hypothetical protein|nr:hypothetical protein [Chitinophagaceae bacterium]
MAWYYYFGGFWAGMFLANFVPHFITGISGNKFPTPFAKPPGKGLSSPVLNVVWGLLNLVIGFLLFKAAKISIDDTLSLIIFFIGIALMSIFSSINFAKKDKDN